jgi:fermentation-respiration switch protein FrsA (DUF1100 family)
LKTDVRFPSSGLTLAGHLYTPDTPIDGRLPAIVVGHPTTGVKEQTAGLYAERLAQRGFVALAFDAAYQGESTGEPRGLEDPFQRAEDVRNAVTYLTTLDEVDADRIGVLGICGSGGYVPFAAQTDHRMRAVATVSAVDIPTLFRSPDPDAFEQLVAQAGVRRSQEAAGEPPALVDALPTEIDENTPKGTREFFEYYRTPRGQHPRSTNKWVARSADVLAQFDPYAEVHRIAPRPLLMIAGTEAESLAFSEGAVAKAGDTAELYRVEGATHVDLYDRDPYVEQAVTRLTAFFAEHLPA